MASGINAAEVRVAITGEMFSAPLTEAKPTGAAAALATAWEGHGYSDEEGFTESWDDSVDDIVAWQNATIVRAARTSSKATFSTKLIQTRGSNLELYYPGSTVEVSGAEWKIDVLPANSDRRRFVFNVVDGDSVERIVIGLGEVTERGDVVRRNGEPVGYEVTITAYPDEDGILFSRYSNDEAWGLGLGS